MADGGIPIHRPRTTGAPDLAGARRAGSAREGTPRAPSGISQHAALRVAPGALVAFIGVAFVVVTLTGAQGAAFVGLVLASSLLLVLIVGYLAFAGDQARSEQTLLDEFDWTETTWQAPDATGLEVAERGLRTSAPPGPAFYPASSPVQAYVENLVAVPPAPTPPATPASRRAYVATLRAEGNQLIRLARVTGVDTEPYRLYLLDARTAAFEGDMEASLTSLRLANELLRRAVESALLKHQSRVSDPRTRGVR